MKHTHRHLLVAAGLAMFVPSCASTLNTTRVPMSSVLSSADASLAGKLHAEINNYRSSIGHEPLRRHAGLDRMAQQHSEFMRLNRGKFSLAGSNVTHYGFDARVLRAQRGMHMENLAENVVAGQRMKGNIPAQLVNAWKNSPDHAYNLNNDWSVTGIGVAVDSDGTVFATQIFATENHSQMELMDRFRQ